MFLKWRDQEIINQDRIAAIDVDRDCVTIHFYINENESFLWKLKSEQEQMEALEYILQDNVKKVKPPNATGKKSVTPKNFDDCFEMLWAAKGKRGSKAKAKEKFKSYCVNESESDVMSFTQMLIQNIESRNKTELGAPEQHLTSYINGRYWES